MYPGVFTVFWTALSCCQANFPTDVSKCVDAATPEIVITPAPTSSPTASVLPVVTSEEITIPPIPMTLINLPTPIELDEIQKRGVENILMNSTSNDIESALNVTVQSMKVSTRMDAEEERNDTVSLDIQPIVIATSEMAYSVPDVSSSIVNTLNKEKEEISSQLEKLFGPNKYTDNVILYFGEPISTPHIQPKPELAPVSGPESNDSGKGSNNVLTIALASSFSALLVVGCGGLMIWRRQQQNKHELLTNQIVATELSNKLERDSVVHQQTTDESSNSRRELDRHDEGYDGGNSSYMNSICNESDFSYPATTDESSKEGDSVLGLLYYDGPDSSESDEDGRQSRAASRASRRSKRSSRSKRSQNSKASTSSHKPKSRRSSRRNSTMDKLDEDTEYRHNKRDPDGFDGSTIMSETKNGLEPQTQQGSTFVYRGSSLSPTTAPSIAGDSIFDRYPTMRSSAGVESVSSGVIYPTRRSSLESLSPDPPGSTNVSYSDQRSIGTTRSRGEESTRANSVSVNSTGEHTGASLLNQPEVKFG